MPTHRISTLTFERTPVRVPQWNASIRAGDDFKLALTLYADDSGTPAQVNFSQSRFALWPDRPRDLARSDDYGFGYFTGGSIIAWPGMPMLSATGFTTPVRGGGVNFAIPGTSTAGLWCGRYRLSVQIDLPDGEYSRIEGVLQVREAWALPGLVHSNASFFQLNFSQLNTAILAASLVNGVPVDVDGFPLTDVIAVPAPTSTVLQTTLRGLPRASDGLLPSQLWNNGGLLAVTAPWSMGMPPVDYTLAGSLPVSDAGLTAGQLWDNGGFLGLPDVDDAPTVAYLVPGMATSSDGLAPGSLYEVGGFVSRIPVTSTVFPATLPGLPMSDSGLLPSQLWNNSGMLSITPPWTTPGAPIAYTLATPLPPSGVGLTAGQLWNANGAIFVPNIVDLPVVTYLAPNMATSSAGLATGTLYDAGGAVFQA